MSSVYVQYSILYLNIYIYSIIDNPNMNTKGIRLLIAC